VETQKKLLLRAWIEAILYHALERVSESDRQHFIHSEMRALEEDFDVKIEVGDDLVVEIDYLDKRLLS
jgi:hypothetical protein